MVTVRGGAAEDLEAVVGGGGAPAGQLGLGRVGTGQLAGRGGDADGPVEALDPGGHGEAEEPHRRLPGDPESVRDALRQPDHRPRLQVVELAAGLVVHGAGQQVEHLGLVLVDVQRGGHAGRLGHLQHREGAAAHPPPA